MKMRGKLIESGRERKLESNCACSGVRAGHNCHTNLPSKWIHCRLLHTQLHKWFFFNFNFSNFGTIHCHPPSIIQSPIRVTLLDSWAKFIFTPK